MIKLSMVPEGIVFRQGDFLYLKIRSAGMNALSLKSFTVMQLDHDSHVEIIGDMESILKAFRERNAH